MNNTPRINLHLPRSLSPARNKSRSKSPSPSGARNDTNCLQPGVAGMASGSATGNPRNKCALQPGHSLMDWIRLGNSGKDLAGTGGRMRAVTPAELASHNQIDNAWIAIRGKVYNIVHYLDYHPGGPDELMRGAGKDATQLFDQIHAWVNYESLLSKCLIGPLKQAQMSEEEFKRLFDSSQSTPKSSPSNKMRRSTESLRSSEAVKSDADSGGNKSSSEGSLNEATKSADVTSPASHRDSPKQRLANMSEASKFKYPTLVLTKADSIKSDNIESGRTEPVTIKAVPPRLDWLQKVDAVTLILYTKSLCNPQCEVLASDGSDKSLNINVSYDNHIFAYDLSLEDGVVWPCSVSINHDTGKLEVQFKKVEPKIWKSYGKTEKCDIRECPITIDEERRECFVVDKWDINHNTYVILVEHVNNRCVMFPIGYHCRVFCNAEDLLSRSYTPVPQYLVPEFRPQKSSSDLICLMVKKYEQGAVSTWLTSRAIEDKIFITKPLGNFCLKTLQDVTQLFLISAGTGLTPMLNLIQFSLNRRNPRCMKVDLLFFNRSEKDILWREQLNMLSAKDDRFQHTDVLSEPSSTWQGYKGHINQALLKIHYAKVQSDDEVSNKEESQSESLPRVENFLMTGPDSFYCVCGPSPFTQLTKTLLTGLGCNEDRLHCFLG